ncbi:potassium channel family protein [Chloroflexi bacterium TSY]|nr:potassium channel family protein [Chloroflexi bacterium TSY]
MRTSREGLAPIEGRASRIRPYDMLILASTILALIAMVVLLLPAIPQTIANLAYILDFSLSFVFLVDFLRNLVYAPERRKYLLRWGWMDLLGSIPALITLPAWRILRLLRLARIVQMFRQMRGGNAPQRMVEHRGESLLSIIVFIGMIFIWLSSTVILTVEQTDPNANIRTSGDALWWAIVTFSTVGYGDRFPVTSGGRLFAVILMLGGRHLDAWWGCPFLGADGLRDSKHLLP